MYMIKMHLYIYILSWFVFVWLILFVEIYKLLSHLKDKQLERAVISGLERL